MGLAIVSILVLLEPPLIRKLMRFINLKKQVSILVLLEPPLIPGKEQGNGLLLLSFNPCFTGTSSHTSSSASRGQSSGQRFNPCFTGTSSHTRMGISIPIIPILFQSLFYWNLLSYFSDNVALKVFHIGFNPCFTGTSSHTTPSSVIVFNVTEFQSLFYWNLLSYLISQSLRL